MSVEQKRRSDAAYEFELELFLRGFCEEIISDAEQDRVYYHSGVIPPDRSSDNSSNRRTSGGEYSYDSHVQNLHDRQKRHTMMCASPDGYFAMEFDRTLRATKGSQCSSGGRSDQDGAASSSRDSDEEDEEDDLEQSSDRGGGTTARRKHRALLSVDERNARLTPMASVVSESTLTRYVEQMAEELILFGEQISCTSFVASASRGGGGGRSVGQRPGSSSKLYTGSSIHPNEDNEEERSPEELQELVHFYLECVSGPFFAADQHAKAYLQQVHVLASRESLARQRVQKQILQWRSAFRSMLLHVKQWDRQQHEERMRVVHRAVATKDELVRQWELGISVIAFLHLQQRYGPDFAFEFHAQMTQLLEAEMEQRQQTQRSELEHRAELLAGDRMARSVMLSPATVGRQHARRAGRHAGGETTSSHDDSRPASRQAWDWCTSLSSLGKADTVSTMPYVNPIMKSHARLLNLLEDSSQRAEVVRQTSQKLVQRMQSERAASAASNRSIANAMRDASQRRRSEWNALRAVQTLEQQQQAAIEKNCYEWLAYEARHPEARGLHLKHLKPTTNGGDPNHSNHHHQKTTPADSAHAKSALKSSSASAAAGGPSRLRSAPPMNSSIVPKRFAVAKSSGGGGVRPSSSMSTTSASASFLPPTRHRGSPNVQSVLSDHPRHAVEAVLRRHQGSAPTTKTPNDHEDEAAAKQQQQQQHAGHPNHLQDSGAEWSVNASTIPAPEDDPNPDASFLGPQALTKSHSQSQEGGPPPHAARTPASGVPAQPKLRSSPQKSNVSSTSPQKKPSATPQQQNNSSSTQRAKSSAAGVEDASHNSQPNREDFAAKLLPREKQLYDALVSVRQLMQQIPYRFAQSTPIVLNEDGGDATQGRNLLGDDVEVFLLSPPERVLRWNLKAQQAMRLQEWEEAEKQISNAVATLQTLDKESRRMRRRSSAASLHPQQQQQPESRVPAATGNDQVASGNAAPSTSVDRQQEEGHDAPAGTPMKRSAAVTVEEPAAAAVPSIHRKGSTAPSAASHFLLTPNGALTLQRLKILTFTQRAQLNRMHGRLKDALLDLETVLATEEALLGDGNPTTSNHNSTASGANSKSDARGRHNGSDTKTLPQTKQQPSSGARGGDHASTLLNVAALLLQRGTSADSLRFARRAGAVLLSALRDNEQAFAEGSSSNSRRSPPQSSSVAASPTASSPTAAASGFPSAQHQNSSSAADASPRDASASSPPPHQQGGGNHHEVLLHHGTVLQDCVSYYHNVAMALAALPKEHKERSAAKATHQAALRLSEWMLGADHALTVRVREYAPVIAQMLAS